MERPKANLTMHGLRYSFANNLYKKILKDRLTEHSKTGEEIELEKLKRKLDWKLAIC